MCKPNFGTSRFSAKVQGNPIEQDRATIVVVYFHHLVPYSFVIGWNRTIVQPKP